MAHMKNTGKMNRISFGVKNINEEDLDPVFLKSMKVLMNSLSIISARLIGQLLLVK